MILFIFQILIIIFQITDWHQTKYMSQFPDKYYEMNPILGKHPTDNQLDWYFRICIVGSVLLTSFLEPEVKFIWQIINLIPEMWCVFHNVKVIRESK